MLCFRLTFWQKSARVEKKKIFIIKKASFYAVDTLKHGEANEYD